MLFGWKNKLQTTFHLAPLSTICCVQLFISYFHYICKMLITTSQLRTSPNEKKLLIKSYFEFYFIQQTCQKC